MSARSGSASSRAWSSCWSSSSTSGAAARLQALSAASSRRASGRFQDPEALHLLHDRQVLPPLAVVQDDQPAEIAADLLVDPVDGDELVPGAADRIGQRRIDPIVLVTADIPPGVDAV